MSSRSTWARVIPCQGKGRREGLEGRRKGRRKERFSKDEVVEVVSMR